MSAQQLLNDSLGCLPLRVYGRGAVLTLLREMGFAVKNKTPLTVLDIFRDNESPYTPVRLAHYHEKYQAL
jgi:hypothetical protein